MNELLFFASIIVYFSVLLIAYKFFGRAGLLVWLCFAIILANIEVLKVIDFFGFSVTLGNVLYASTYLATDIISEKYGRESAAKTVNLGFFFLLAYILVTQFMMLFIPGSEDFAHQPMTELFALAPRLCIASLATYLITQKLDIWLFHKIKEKTNSKHLWIRNCFSTMTSQLFDSVVFNLIAFYGIFSNQVLLSIIITTYVVKFIISLLDTPFIYLAMKIKPREL